MANYLSLPYEMREKILRNVLDKPTPISIGNFTRNSWSTLLPKEYLALRRVHSVVADDATMVLLHYSRIDYWPYTSSIDREKPNEILKSANQMKWIFSLVKQARLLGVVTGNQGPYRDRCSSLSTGLGQMLDDLRLCTEPDAPHKDPWCLSESQIPALLRQQHVVTPRVDAPARPPITRLACRTLTVKQKYDSWGTKHYLHASLCCCCGPMGFRERTQTNAYVDLTKWSVILTTKVTMPNLENFVFELHEDLFFDLRSYARLARNLTPLLPQCRVTATLLNEMPLVPARREFEARDLDGVPVRPILWDIIPCPQAEAQVVHKPWDSWDFDSAQVELVECHWNESDKLWTGLKPGLLASLYTVQFDTAIKFECSREFGPLANAMTKHCFKVFLGYVQDILRNDDREEAEWEYYCGEYDDYNSSGGDNWYVFHADDDMDWDWYSEGFDHENGNTDVWVSFANYFSYSELQAQSGLRG